MYEVKVDRRDPDHKTDIFLTRGDTFISTVTGKDKMTLEPYVPVAGDVVRFAMKKAYSDTECLIRKEIPIDTMLLRIEAQDTKPFPVRTYVYDIEITFADGRVDTFIYGDFKLLNEVD